MTVNLQLPYNTIVQFLYNLINKTKHNCLLCMLSIQCISYYSSVLKMQLEMFSKCAQFKLEHF